MSDHGESLGSSPESSGDSFSETGSHSDIPSDTTGSSESLTARIENAMNRAVEQSESNDNSTGTTEGKRQIEDSESSSGQAATADNASGNKASGDSTPPQDETDTLSSGANDGTSGQSHKTDDSTPATANEKQQSLTPPDNWPEDRRKAFETLPDTGKSVLMSINKDMEKGLKKSFDKLANDRKQIESSFGLEAEQLKDLADRYQTFQKDPVATISQLAEEAGIEVYFNQQTEEIPEFDSQADLVKWLQNQSRNEARQAAATEAKALKDQRHQDEVKQRMEQEFAQAYKAHPDLSDHKDAVIKYISGFNLPVEMAYRLATYEGLTQLAQNGHSTKAELDKARSELEKLQKLSTMPPGRPDGRSQKQRANGLDMFESAYTAAEKAITRQSS